MSLIADQMRASIALIEAKNGRTRPAWEWPCDFAEYCADTSHVSRSMLDDFRYSRRYFHAKHIAKTLPAEVGTDEMKFGDAAHLCVLEPERIESTIRVIPAEVLASNGAKNGGAWKEYAAAHAGFCLLKQHEFDALDRLVSAVWANARARSLLELPGPTEHTIRWEDEFTSLPCKARRDKIISGAIVDLKTCPDSNPGPFAKKCAELGYHRQAAYYMDGHLTATKEPVPFVFIAVAKEPPHDVSVIEIHPDDVELGRRQNRAAMTELAECFASGDWSNPHEAVITTVRLPNYAHYQDDWRMQ